MSQLLTILTNSDVYLTLDVVPTAPEYRQFQTASQAFNPDTMVFDEVVSLHLMPSTDFYKTSLLVVLHEVYQDIDTVIGVILVPLAGAEDHDTRSQWYDVLVKPKV